MSETMINDPMLDQIRKTDPIMAALIGSSRPKQQQPAPVTGEDLVYTSRVHGDSNNQRGENYE